MSMSSSVLRIARSRSIDATSTSDAGAEDADPGAELLDLREDVRREEHRLPAVRRLGDAATELLLHQRIEPARRLVQQQHVRSRRERCDERDLLAVALRVRAGALVELEVEPLDELGAVPASTSPWRLPSSSRHSSPVSFGHRLTSPGT